VPTGCVISLTPPCATIPPTDSAPGCHGTADLINFCTQKVATATQKLFIIIQMIHDNKMHKLNRNFFSAFLIVFSLGVKCKCIKGVQLN